MRSAVAQTRNQHGCLQLNFHCTCTRFFAMISRWKHCLLTIFVSSFSTWIISQGSGEKVVCGDLFIGQYPFLNPRISLRTFEFLNNADKFMFIFIFKNA